MRVLNGSVVGSAARHAPQLKTWLSRLRHPSTMTIFGTRWQHAPTTGCGKKRNDFDPSDTSKTTPVTRDGLYCRQ